MNENVTAPISEETLDEAAEQETVQAAEPTDDQETTQTAEPGAEPGAADSKADAAPEQETQPIVRELVGFEHYAVIDANNRYVTFVLCSLYSVGDEVEIEPQYYTLPDGYRLVKKIPPTMRKHAGTAGFVDPVWDDDTEAWAEGLDAEALAEWEATYPDPMSIDKKRAAKTAEISAACNAAITAGMDVETTQGTEHFSLQETDQINLTAAVTAVQQGAAGYPYHADGELCRMFTAAEIGAVGEASIAHKLYHTTYCNHLFAWIRRATASELAGITYGAELPEDLAASMQALLTQAGSTTGEV